jgi:hypothetical protein
MPDNHALGISNLERRTKELTNTLSKLAEIKDFEELIRLIRLKGWTTPAELRFANAMVESMASHATVLAKTKAELMEASRLVEIGVPELAHR